jgi:uncharacterized protein YabN with tetrapyrrole methylase and pyrophosphatase domain
MSVDVEVGKFLDLMASNGFELNDLDDIWGDVGDNIQEEKEFVMDYNGGDIEDSINDVVEALGEECRIHGISVSMATSCLDEIACRFTMSFIDVLNPSFECSMVWANENCVD